MQGETQPQFYRVREVAERLGISTSTVYNLIESGHFAHAKVGRTVLIPRGDFDRYLAKARVEARK